MQALTTVEQGELEKHEQVIEQGLKTFVDVGNALLAIRDGRLYRADYGTFEGYCSLRWNIERRRAYQLMDAASVVSNVNHGTQILPTSERQARPLTKLEPEHQHEVWQTIVDGLHESGKMAALLIVTHNTPADRQVDVANCEVIEIRLDGIIKPIKRPVKCKEAIDRLIALAGLKY
jgi:hypothetical protein